MRNFYFKRDRLFFKLYQYLLTQSESKTNPSCILPEFLLCLDFRDYCLHMNYFSFFFLILIVSVIFKIKITTYRVSPARHLAYNISFGS